jgi:hypothetical protein
MHVSDRTDIAHITKVVFVYRTRNKYRVFRIRRRSYERGSFLTKFAWADYKTFCIRRCSFCRGTHIQRFCYIIIFSFGLQVIFIILWLVISLLFYLKILTRFNHSIHFFFPNNNNLFFKSLLSNEPFYLKNTSILNEHYHY